MSDGKIAQLRERIGAGSSAHNVDVLRVLLRAALDKRARDEAARGVFRCCACRENFVDPCAGEDTCADCLRRI